MATTNRTTVVHMGNMLLKHVNQPLRNTLIALVSVLWATSAHADEAQLRVIYEKVPHQNAEHQLVRLKQDDALPGMVQFVNDTVPFAEPVILRIGAEDGPLFDPQLNEIWVPVEFLTEIDQRFVKARLATTIEQRNDAMLDVFMHTLLHEVAHTIIAQFEIPSLGKEEDAADNLANVLLLEYVPDGDLIALNAADMFALEDEDTESLEAADFWDEHSLNIQRYYTTLCHVYGAFPEDNEQLVEIGELSTDKAVQCIDEYAQISSDWLYVLKDLK